MEMLRSLRGDKHEFCLTVIMWTIGVGVRMSTLDSNVAGSIPASICFLLEQGTLSALLQSTQL